MTSVSQSSYLDATPSPSRALTEHPLSALIKTEADAEETTASCSAPSLEQEVDAEPKQEVLLTVKKEEEHDAIS